MGFSYGVLNNSHVAYLSFESPALTPDRPVGVRIYSEDPITIQSVEKSEFIDLRELGRVPEKP